MIRVERLGLRFGESLALGGIDLSVGAGEALGLVGTNGSGRTALLDVLATLVRPSSGSASVAGYDVVAKPLEVRRRIGVVRQSVCLHDELTVGEHLEFIAASRNLVSADRTARISALVERSGLRPDSRIAQLTRGHRQRLAIASAVLPDPPVLLLDDPLGHLDPIAHRDFKQMLEELRRNGSSLLFVSNSLEDLQDACEHVAFLHRGRLLDVREASALDGSLRATLLELIAAAEQSSGGTARETAVGRAWQ